MLPRFQISFWLAFVLVTSLADFVHADDFSQRGSLAINRQMVQIPRKNGSSSQTLVYYPTAGDVDQQLDPRQAPYPIVAFTSPVVPMTAYEQTLSHLASWGFVVMAPTDCMELLPDQSAVADDMRLCLDFMAAENVRRGSHFYSMIDTHRAGFCGHSWGGACSVIAGAKEPTRVKVVVNLACWNKSVPSAESCVNHLACPLVMLTGDDDALTPLPSVERIYNAAMPAKSFIVLRGGTHFGFIDHWLSFSPQAQSAHNQQLAIARHYMTAALLIHLRKRVELQPMLWAPGAENFGNVIRKIDLGNASSRLPGP